MKLSLSANLPCPVFFFGFPERLQRMTAVAMCTVSITVLEPRAFNAEFQYFIPWFNKISSLCRQQPRGDEASNDGCNSGPTGPDFTDYSIV